MASDNDRAAPAPAEAPATPSPVPQTTNGSSQTSSRPHQSSGPIPKAKSGTRQPPQRQLSLSDPNLRSCFICLQNSNETPDANWVNPCPCTLEAHEDCLLRWVAETEASGKKKLRCPACKGRIRVVEPWDPVIQFRQRFSRLYGRVSPGILGIILYSMGIAGSGFYGILSLGAIGGWAPAERWLGLRDILFRRSTFRATLSFVGKSFLLHLIAPGLLLHRVLGGVLSIFTLPASLLYGATLVWQNRMPVWPPSPAWAITMLPYLGITYNSVYWELFGPLERRLNRVLRGRPANEEPRPAAQQGNAAAAQEAREEGIGTALWRIGHAVVNLLDGDEDAAGDDNPADPRDDGELQARLENEPLQDEPDAGGGHLRLELELVVEDADGEGAPEEDDELPADMPANDDAPPAVAPANDNDVAAEDAAAPEQPAEDVVPRPENNRRQGEPDARAGSTLSDIFNATVTQLLFPFLSAGIGGALYLALPRPWVSRLPGSPPTGLLQERWGRSLVGGCVFLVLRDALNLYTKYRRAEVKKNRKVVDQGRRRDRSAKAAGSSL